MAKYRQALPQLSDGIFLTDGGMETTLIYHDGVDLPHFAAFDLMKSEAGRTRIRNYYARYAAIARDNGAGFVFESPTWRASRDWGVKLGYSPEALAEINRGSIELLVGLRRVFENGRSRMVISGCLGPRGDGYQPGRMMSPAEAQDYHSEQIATFRDTEADLISAFTLNYPEEAVGIARAARSLDMPVVISFTAETDGRLPTGQALKDAIGIVDAETGGAPAYYMINCAHPTHLESAWAAGEPWVKRIRGLRANSSRRSHAELDQATELDAGNPVELGAQYGALRRSLPHLTILGGCCGTDHRHLEAICHSCLGHRHAA